MGSPERKRPVQSDRRGYVGQTIYLASGRNPLVGVTRKHQSLGWEASVVLVLKSTTGGCHIKRATIEKEVVTEEFG